MRKQADEKIGKIFKGLCEIPSLPAAVERIIQLSEKESTPREFADLIEKDQGLTAKVLRLVNSAFYSLRTPMASLRHASALLGTRTLKSLAVSVSVMPMLQRTCAGLDPGSFWRHSIAGAVVSQKLGSAFLAAFEDHLYVAGLLHDVGVALFVHNLPAEYPVVLRAARLERRKLSEVEEEILGVSHAEVGYMLATRWRLPPLICDCLRWHESPSSARGAVPPEHEPAVDIVAFADQWTASAGFDFLGGEESRGLTMPEIPECARSDTARMEELLKDSEEEIARKELFLFPAKDPVACT